MSDYGTPPPPSTGTTPVVGVSPSPPPAQSGQLPITGADIGAVAVLGCALTVGGAALVARRRRRRDPWAEAERERKREWDKFARR